MHAFIEGNPQWKCNNVLVNEIETGKRTATKKEFVPCCTWSFYNALHTAQSTLCGEIIHFVVCLFFDGNFTLCEFYEKFSQILYYLHRDNDDDDVGVDDRRRINNLMEFIACRAVCRPTIAHSRFTLALALSISFMPIIQFLTRRKWNKHTTKRDSKVGKRKTAVHICMCIEIKGQITSK